MRKLFNKGLWVIFLPVVVLLGSSGFIARGSGSDLPSAAAAASVAGNCACVLGSSAAYFNASGGTGGIDLTTDTDCAWTAVSSNAWLTITSPTNGIGNGTVSYMVATNSSLSARTGGLRIGGQLFTVSQEGAPCTFVLQPTGRLHNHPAEFATFDVIAPTGCDWTAVNTNDWMAIKLYTNGTGTGILRYSVFENENPIPRVGSLTVNGEPFTITQLAAPCTFSILPTNYLVGSATAAGGVTVFTADGCNWSASNTNRWISISPTNGSGGGVVSYVVAPSYTASDRTGVVSIAGRRFTVTQLGTSCRYVLSPTNKVNVFGPATGTVSVATTNGCRWNVSNTNSWITITSLTNGLGSGTILYSMAANPSSLTRTGMLVIADQLFPLIQAGAPCTTTLTPATGTNVFGPDTGAFSVAAPLDCPWTARTTNSWIKVTSSTNGTGNGTVSYSVDLNTGPARTGFVLIGTKSFTVKQGEAAPMTITAQPASQSVLAGATVVFNASASGTAPVAVQWRFNGTNLVDGLAVSGATTARLTLSGVQWWQAGGYSMVASNIRGSVTTAAAVLAINTAPALAPIGNKTVNVGAPLTLRAFGADVDIPAQALTYSLTTTAPSGASLNPASGVFTWPAARGPGTNVLTVRVTDNGLPPLSATQSFSISVITAAMTNVTLVPTGSVWRYRDTGENLALAWTLPSFSDSAWKSGPAALGYGNGNESTVVSYGPSSSSKYITTYFRRAFTVADPSSLSALSLRGLRDDGLVVYLNGSEVYRDNMPAGPVNYLTLATAGVNSSNTPASFASPLIDPGYLVPGQNVITAEIHQNSAGSSAILFDLELSGAQNFIAPAVVVQPQSVAVPEGADVTLSVVALGAPPLRHQWYFKGALLPNETNATLSLGRVPVSKAGGYADVVTNYLGSVASQVATLTVTVNTPPVLAPIADRSVDEGSLLIFTASASDADVPAQSLTFSLDPGAPSGAGINPSSGVFTWTPTEAQGPSTNTVTIRVTDNGIPPVSDSKTITITVREVNAAPALSAIGDKTVTEGTLLTFTASASDPDVPAQALTVRLDAGAPSGASINPSSGVFTWTPTEAQGPSTTTATIRVTDNGSPALSAFETITITVLESNTAPVLATLADKAVVKGTLLTFAAAATDADLPVQALTYSLGPGAPSGATINPISGAFTWVPSTNTPAPGTNTVTIRVTDNGSPGLSDAKTFNITVIPSFSTNFTLIPAGAVWKYRDTGEDLGTPWSALGYDDSAWSSGPALLGYAGGSEATVVSFGPNSSAKYITTYFRRTITVATPSALSLLNLSVRRDDGVVVYINGTEVYRDNMPAGPINYLTVASLSVAGTDKTSFHVSPPFDPALLVPGDNVVAAEVHQRSGTSTSMDFDLDLEASSVTAGNTAPVLRRIGSKAVTRGSLLSFTVSATDVDLPAQTLIYSLDAAPAGATIDSTSGVFSWTPVAAQSLGTNQATIRVSDNGSPSLSTLETIAIVVGEPGSLALLPGTTNGVSGAQVSVPILVNGFTSLSAIQFSLHWDASVAAYGGVEQFGLTGITLGTDETNDGTLTVSWDDAGGLSQTLADGMPLFAARFQLIGSPGAASSVWIDGTPTPMEAADADLHLVPVTTLPGQLTTDSAIASAIVRPGGTSSSPPLASITVDSHGGVSLQWNTSPGVSYRLQYTTNLSSKAWTNLGSDVVATGSTASASDGAGAFRQRFYRVVRLGN